MSTADEPERDKLLIASSPKDRPGPALAAPKEKLSLQTQLSEGMGKLKSKLAQLEEAERTRQKVVQARPPTANAKVEPVKATGGDAQHNAVLKASRLWEKLAKVEQRVKLMTKTANVQTNDVTALRTKLQTMEPTMNGKPRGQNAVGTADSLKREASSLDTKLQILKSAKRSTLTKGVKTVSAGVKCLMSRKVCTTKLTPLDSADMEDLMREVTQLETKRIAAPKQVIRKAYTATDEDACAWRGLARLGEVWRRLARSGEVLAGDMLPFVFCIHCACQGRADARHLHI